VRGRRREDLKGEHLRVLEGGEEREREEKRSEAKRSEERVKRSEERQGKAGQEAQALLNRVMQDGAQKHRATHVAGRSNFDFKMARV
jgi:hypothetical protein